MATRVATEDLTPDDFHVQLKRSIEDEITALRDNNFSDNIKQIQDMLRLHNENIKQCEQKRQQLSERAQLDQTTDKYVPTVEEIDKLLSVMQQEWNRFEEASKNEMAKLQRLEDVAVKICGTDYSNLIAKMDSLVKEYEKFVSKISDEEFDVTVIELQQLNSDLNSKVESLNELIRDIEKRVEDLEKEYYNTDTVKNRIKPGVDQHRTVTNFDGILGRCATELMWCLTKQSIECERIYQYPDVTPELLQSSIKGFQTEITEHDSTITQLINDIKHCGTVNFAVDVIEVVSETLKNTFTMTKTCFKALEVHYEQYYQYFEVHKTIKDRNSDYEKIISQMDSHWKDSSLPNFKKLDIMQMCQGKIQELVEKIMSLQQDCQNVYSYDLRSGPLPEERTKVIPSCDCPQLHLSTDTEYFLVEMRNTKWKIQGAHGSSHFVLSTLLQISPPSPLLMRELDGIRLALESDLTTVTLNIEDAHHIESVLQVKNELSELITWLEPLANQLDQQELIAATVEELQVQHDWLKCCDDNIFQRQSQISRVLSIQEKLDSDGNHMMEQFTDMWENFQTKKTKWSHIFKAAQRCFDSTATAETLIRNQELWILKKRKPPKNQEVLQYVQEIKEQDTSQCDIAVEQTKKSYSQYAELEGKDHDELKRRVDVVSDHWIWLKRIVSKFDNQYKEISKQTEQFENKYQKHLNWLPMMTEYVDDLPKLSTKLDQIKEHKKELEEKVKEVIDKEDEVDDIKSSSRFFETSLQLINEEYNEYVKKLAKCSAPVIVEESEIDKVVPSRSPDLSTSTVETSIVDQAVAVKKQWQRIVEILEQRLDQCNKVIEDLYTFEEQYSNDLAFIEQGEKLINEYQPHENHSLTIRMSKHQELQKRIVEEQKKHLIMLDQGKKLYKLDYIDEDNDIQERVDDIVDKWSELCENSRQWYDDLKEEQEDTIEQEKALSNVIDALKNSDLENPLKQHCKLKPESITLEFVKELQHQFLTKVWHPMEEILPEVDDLKQSSDRLPQETVEAVLKKFQDHFQLLEQQKPELEQIVLRADGYADHLKSVSKWITEADRVLMKATPLADQPQSVEKQLSIIEDIERKLKGIEGEMKEKLALKEKLIEDTCSIALMKSTVDPELLDQFAEDILQTWKAIQDQVTERKQKVGDASKKLKECCSIKNPLEKWLKEAEQKVMKLIVVAKSKTKLEEQLHELKEFIAEVKNRTNDMKSTEDTKDKFVALAKEYEKILQEYSSCSPELEERFARVASNIHARNIKRAKPSVSELGYNVLKEQVEELTQSYEALLANLEKKLTKLQEINDKHLDVVKVAATAEGKIKSIQDRKNQLTGSTSWSRPTLMEQQIDIYSVLEKDCKSVEQDEIQQLRKAFNLLEQARADIPRNYSAIEVTEMDEALQLKDSFTNKLADLKYDLSQIRKKLDRACDEIKNIIQATTEFEEWFDKVEQREKYVYPKQVTSTEFSEIRQQCNDIADEVSNHQTQFDGIIEQTESYLNKFDAPDVKVRNDTLTKRWKQLQEELDKKQQHYEHVVNELISFNDSATQYEKWLRAKKDDITALPLLGWSLEYLEQQKFYAEKLLEEVKNKHEQSYEKIIQPIATEVTTQYKELDCEHINKRVSEEAREYKELMELLNIRLTNIDNKNIMLNSLLAEQEEIKRSLKQIDERADALPENMLSSSDVDNLLKDLQALQDQFDNDKQKVEQVHNSYEKSLATSSQVSPLPHDETNLLKSPLLLTNSGTSIDYVESSIDAVPVDLTTVQGEGFKELQETINSLQKECDKVEGKLTEKTANLTNRKTAIEKYYKDFNEIHKEIECVAERSTKCQVVLNDVDVDVVDDGDDDHDHDNDDHDDDFEDDDDDDDGDGNGGGGYIEKKQLKRIGKLTIRIQKMEAAVKQLCKDTSVLLQGTVPGEESTKFLENNKVTEKKYQDTLDSVVAISDKLKSDNDMIQEISKWLRFLKSWMNEQQKSLNSLKPAAVLSTTLSDQITDSEQLSEEIKSKGKDFEELKKISGQLEEKYANHTILKTVKVVTEQYQDMDNNMTQRKEMLSLFMERVSDYERRVEEFTQWLTDCYKRIDELPVADISTDGLLSQLNNVQELMKEIASKETVYAMVREDCNQLCNDPTNSIGNNEELSLVTSDYHPCADTARDSITELDHRVDELKKKLRDRENEIKEQQGRIYKFQKAINEVGQWLDEKEAQSKAFKLTEIESAKLQEQIAALKVMQEEQTNQQLLLNNLQSLLTDVVSDSSADNPFKQQLEENNELLQNRWQKLTNKLRSNQEDLTDALQQVEKYEGLKAKIEQWIMESHAKLANVGPSLCDPKQAEQNLNEIKAMEDEYEAIYTACCDAADSLVMKTSDPSVTEVLNATVQTLQEEWKELKDQLTAVDKEVGNALGKVNDLNRRLEDMSSWLSEMLMKLNGLEPCGTLVHVINDKISESKIIMAKINSREESIKSIQSLGQEVMSQCSPQDKSDIQLKLKQINADFDTVKVKVEQNLEYLAMEKTKAEDYEKRSSDFDNWLKEKESIVERLEELVIDSKTLKQQKEEIEELTEEGNKKVNELNKSEETLLDTKHDIIAQYERTLESTTITTDRTLELSVDKPQIPNFAKRQGAQEVVSENKQLNKRYEDLKCSLENQLIKVQEFLLQVQTFESSLSDLDEWLIKEKESVDSIELCACTIEKITSELTVIKNCRSNLKSKETDLNNLRDGFANLTKAIKVMKGKQKAEQKLSETIKQMEDLLNLIDDKENQITKREQELGDYIMSCEQFLEKLNDVQNVIETSLDLTLADEMTEEIKSHTDSIQKLTIEIQDMKPTLEKICNDASLLEGTVPDEESAKLFQASLADMKKRYQDTVESSITLREQSGKMQEISKLLQHLKSWLTEQQSKLESLKPAAVSAVLVSDQITENEQLIEELKSKEKEFEELKEMSGQLEGNYGNHGIQKTVRDATDQYQNIDNNLTQRREMLLQFRKRVSDYERQVEEFTQWLIDCRKRVKELPVADISIDGLLSQLNEIKKFNAEITVEESKCVTIRKECDHLCNDPTNSMGNNVELSLVTPDYHPSANTARDKVTQLDQRVEELKKMLKEREDELKKREGKIKRLQEDDAKMSEWLNENEHQLTDINLSKVESTEIQKQIAAIKLMQEEHSSKQLTLDNIELLLTDIVSDSSADNPFKQQLEENNEHLKKRWQKLANALKSKQEDLTDALQLAEKYEECKAEIEQWMMEASVKLEQMGPPPSNPEVTEQEYNKIKVMEDEYEKLRPKYTICCETANSLAAKTTDPSATEALNIPMQQLREQWEGLQHQLNKADDKFQNALDKASGLDRCYKEISGWLTEMLDKLKHLDPCAAQVDLINDQISEATATLEEINSKADSVQDVQTIGQTVMSWCNPDDQNDVQAKLNEIISSYTNVEEVVKLHLKQLEKEKVKAEDHKKLLHNLDDWLKDKEDLIQQWEDFAIDSGRLKQQAERIKEFEREVLDGNQSMRNLNDSENELLGPDDSNENVSKRQGAQEVVDEDRKLHNRYEDLKCSINNQLAKAQEMLCQVQNYETAESNFDDWLRKENEAVKLIKKFACTSEDINTELAKIQEIEIVIEQKGKDLEDLCMIGTALINECEMERSKKEAEEKFLDINSQWGELLKLIDEKKSSLMAKQKEVEHYINLLNQFSSWMNSVEMKLEEPLTLVGDPNKIASHLHDMKELAQQITNHKSELDTMIHYGKVAEYHGPAEEADSQPTQPHSQYSVAIERYNTATVACQQCVCQLEQTLNKISEVKEDIEQLITSLNDYQSKISNTGRLRVRPDEAKKQLEFAQELDAKIRQLEPNIEEKQTAGQLYISPEIPAAKAVETDNSLNEMVETLTELSRTVKQMATLKLKELEDRLDKTAKFEQDIHEITEWLSNKQDELSNAGSVRGIPDGIKEQLALHMEFQKEIEDKKSEVASLKKLAEELKQGAPEVDEEYLNDELSYLNDTVVVLTKSCAKHQQELENGLIRSNSFNEKLQKAIVGVNKKKQELEMISPAHLDIPSVKNKLDELHDFNLSLNGLSSQVAEVKKLGEQLMDSCSDMDADELTTQFEELTILWNELNSDVQQKIQHHQHKSSQLGLFHEFMIWKTEIDGKLKETLLPGVEPSKVKSKIAELEKMNEEVSSHQPDLVMLLKSLDNLMTETSDPSDTNYDKIHHNMEDAKKWCDEAMTNRRKLLEEALRRAEAFRVAFQEEMLWLNNANDQLIAEWHPHGLSENCEEEIEQHKKFITEVSSHNEPIRTLMPSGEDLKLQGNKEEKIMVDGWLKRLQDEFNKLKKAIAERESQLQAALTETEHFKCSYQTLLQWVDSAGKAQEEVDPIKCELDTVQHQLDVHKATMKKVLGKEEELNKVLALGQSLNDKCVEEDGRVISQWLEELQAKWDNLNIQLTQRKTQLEEALLAMGQFQVFDELWTWLHCIHEELLNLEPITGKIDAVTTLITKHTAIQKQLVAKQSAYEAVSKAGKQFISQKSEEDGETLQKKINDLEQKWTEVCKLSLDWQQKLGRANGEFEKFNKHLVPLQRWLVEIDIRLHEPVHGDSNTIEKLIEYQQQLQEELAVQKREIEAVKCSGEILSKDLLDNPEAVNASLKLLSTQWDEVCKALENRQNRLDKALKEAKSFKASYDDTLEWVQIQSDHLATHQLAPLEIAETALQQQNEEQKKFNDELLAKQADIDKVLETGSQILVAAHPDAVPILQNMVEALDNGWQKLNEMANNRSKSLATKLLQLQGGVEESLMQLSVWVEKKLASPQPKPEAFAIDLEEDDIEAQLSEKQSILNDMMIQKPTMEGLKVCRSRKKSSSIENEVATKIKVLSEKWEKLSKQTSNDRTRLTETKQLKLKLAKETSFNYEDWRKRFTGSSDQPKQWLNNLFIKFDANHDRTLNREGFIKALKSSEFPMSIIEMELVADDFFPNKKNTMYFVPVSVIVSQLMDSEQTEQQLDAIRIEKEIQRELANCTCPSQFQAQAYGEQYKFDHIPRLCLVKLQDSTVMVRVGGGWANIAEFFQKYDPCRSKTMKDLDRKSGRRATKDSKKSKKKQEEHKTAEDTNHQTSAQSKPKIKFVSLKKVDQEMVKSQLQRQKPTLPS